MTTASASPVVALSPTGARVLADLEELLAFYLERGFDENELTEVEVRFASALTRYRFAPPVGKMVSERVHVMTFGGAGAGKSTMTNILLGADVAEVNAQAGYTRHPIAFLKSDSDRPSELWPNWLGILERHDSAEPANVDEHRFGWRRLQGDLSDPGFLRRHVVWDCPDLTAKDSTYYQTRVVEIAALAQVAVYVASDERYNDELPTNFLQAMLDAGKWVVVALTKVAPHEADELVRLFQQQVVRKLRSAERILAVLPIPSPPPGKMSVLWTDQAPHGARFREAIERVTADFTHVQADARRSACKYLKSRQARLLDPLRRDLAEWRGWLELIRQHANEAVARYERDYLARVRHPELEHARGEVVGLFEFAGPLSYLGRGLEWLRTPWRLARSFWKQFTPIRPAPQVDEDRAIEKTRRGLLESLQVTTATRQRRHPLWQALHAALQQDAVELVEPAFYRVRNRQRREIEEQLETVGQTVRAEIERFPFARPALQWARVLVDALMVVGGIWLVGFKPLAVLVVFLAVGAADELVSLAARYYVNRHRAGLVRRQKDNIRELIQVAYIDSLVQLPLSTGRRLASLANLSERLEANLKALAEEHGERGRA